MTYYLWTIGCQMNFADSRHLAEELQRVGLDPAARPEEADLIVLNTCVVRQNAEDKVVGRLTSLRGLKRRRPEIIMAVMGCFVTGGDQAALALRQHYPWVDAFVQPSNISAVLDLARGRLLRDACSTLHPPASNLQSPTCGVPISCGCNHHCTYCIVRLRRGQEVSRPVSDIVVEVGALVRRGAREVTMLGQNVDSYGRDLPPWSPQLVDAPQIPPASSDLQSPQFVEAAERGAGSPPDLADLLEAVHGVDGLLRMRFLTSHPADMSSRLIDTAARLPKVCEHVELPIQSGDDAVLRRMGRGYTAEQYRALVERIRQAMPGLGLATDVIVGFPGETEAQFYETVRLLQDLRFDVVHVAAYSPRPGTPADQLADDVPVQEKERRRKAIDDLQKRIAGEINAQLLDQSVEVLVEGRHKGKWQGRSRTNKLVFFEVGEEDWTGRLVRVRITRASPWSLSGTLARDCRGGACESSHAKRSEGPALSPSGDTHF